MKPETDKGVCREETRSERCVARGSLKLKGVEKEQEGGRWIS